MRNEKIYLVRNIKNGGTYRIGESKLKKEPGEWETILEKKSNVETLDLNAVKEELPVADKITKEDRKLKYTPGK